MYDATFPIHLVNLKAIFFVPKKTKFGTFIQPLLSQPHFEGSVRSPLTLPKMGLGSPPGLPKNQIAGVKTPCIKVLFILLERS